MDKRGSLERPDLSLVVPAYNEAARLPATLRALGEYLGTRPWATELLVVDDGSADGTAEIARSGSTPSLPVRVVSLGVNRGKGAAVKRGVAEAHGARIAFMDADLPYAFEGFDLAMRHLADGADVVIAGRDLPASSASVESPFTRSLAARVYSRLANTLAVRDIPDTQCGFKWFRAGDAKRLFERVTLTSFAFDVELLVLAQRWGLRIDRIPVRLIHAQDSTVRLLQDSSRMFLDLLRINRRLARGVYDRRD